MRAARLPHSSVRTAVIAVGAITTLAAGICVAGVLSSAPASAHWVLTDTSPGAGSSVVEAPVEIEFTFSGDMNGAEVYVVPASCLPAGVTPPTQAEPIEGGSNDLTEAALGAGCENFADGAADVSGTIVTQSIRQADVPTGDIVVLAQVIYSDGHDEGWTYGFTVENGADSGILVAPGASPSPDAATPAPSATPGSAPGDATTPDASAPTATPAATPTAEAAASTQDTGSSPVWVIWAIAFALLAFVLWGGTAAAKSRRKRTSSDDAAPNDTSTPPPA